MWPPLVCRIGGLVNGAEAPTRCAGWVCAGWFAPTRCAGWVCADSLRRLAAPTRCADSLRRLAAPVGLRRLVCAGWFAPTRCADSLRRLAAPTRCADSLRRLVCADSLRRLVCAGWFAPVAFWDRLFCYCIFQGLRARASRVAGSRLSSMCRSSSVSTTNLARHSDDTMDSMVWV